MKSSLERVSKAAVSTEKNYDEYESYGFAKNVCINNFAVPGNEEPATLRALN